MKKFFFFTGIFFSLSQLVGQGFNGSIEFKNVTQKDTNNNVYLVKDKVVKLEQYSKKGNNIEGSYIFDLSNNQMTWVNPKRKLWGKLISETPQIFHGQCVVAKGTGSKVIDGIKCTDYTVKNTEENTVITYWVGDGKFNFFMPLIKLWNHKDKQSIYFMQIKGLPEGSMPLLSEERLVSDGKLITRLEVTKISKTVPDDASMSVPPNYNKFDQ